MFNYKLTLNVRQTVSQRPKFPTYSTTITKIINFKKDLTPPIKHRKKAQKPSTPQIPGRIHIALQTDLYLEEIDPVIPVSEIHVQTDMFMDRPPSPLYVPVKSGVDVTTQIYEGELFDFDVEAEPILEVLVGKVIEQSWMEVLEEEELAALKLHQVIIGLHFCFFILILDKP